MAIGDRIQLPRNPNPQSPDGYMSRGGRPLLFQVTDPTNQPIWPYLLALHTNPRTFNESFQKSKTVVMTYGGFVEWVWADELDTISSDASTGAFMGPYTGLVSGSNAMNATYFGGGTRRGAAGRHGTMAWERQEDLLDLFRHNGAIFDGFGKPVLRGRVMCFYDRGIYFGYFTNFSPKENDEKGFSFELNWEFKVEETVYVFPGATNIVKSGQIYSDARVETQASINEESFIQAVESDTSDNGAPVPLPPFEPQREGETNEQFKLRKALYDAASSDVQKRAFTEEDLLNER
jgi:hypothetical protein